MEVASGPGGQRRLEVLVSCQQVAPAGSDSGWCFGAMSVRCVGGEAGRKWHRVGPVDGSCGCDMWA